MKSLEFYKSLEYDIIIKREELDGEKWYVAYCNEFGISACHGIGDTREEAVNSYLEEKDAFLELLYSRGEAIPEPGTPEAFRAFVKELQGLGLSVKLIDAETGENVANKSIVEEISLAQKAAKKM